MCLKLFFVLEPGLRFGSVFFNMVVFVFVLCCSKLCFLVLDCVPCFLKCCYCSGVLLFPLLCVRYCCSCSLLMFFVFEFVP